MGTITTQSLLIRMNRMMPATAKKYASGKDRDAIRAEIEAEGKQAGIDCGNSLKHARLNNVIGRSGILPIHKNSSFDNYIVNSDDQAKALEAAKSFAYEFKGRGGFVFSGSYGTGKNHLASAIGNHLLLEDYRIMIVTVADLMVKFRECYGKNATKSEERLIEQMVSLDLLVIDEVGVQHGSPNELILLNQIIDRRCSYLRPTGILTNLGEGELSNLLGGRVIERLKDRGGIWVNFYWESFRGTK